MGGNTLFGADVSAPSDSYIARHWRGDLSLARSYWLNGAVIFGLGVNVLAVVAITLTAFAFQDNHGVLLLAVLSEILLQVTVYAWALVGIWRAAGRYRGPRVWAILARVFIVLSVLISATRILADLDALSRL